MKKLLLLPAAILIPILCMAQGRFITPGEAGAVAVKWYIGHMPGQRFTDPSDVTITESFEIGNENDIFYYVCNIAAGGFVAVSAHTANPPVLCYAFSGQYETKNQPENFRAWMAQYQRQISFSLQQKALPTGETARDWDYYLNTPVETIVPFEGREVAPMLHSNWDQGMYYNQQCPADESGPGGHCVTGCVATAIGQLMNYFRWPDTGTGSYSYECPPYGTLSADFGNSTYEWDKMEPLLIRGTAEAAELLFHTGVSVDMVYGPDGSGMYNHKGAYTMKTYFKYSPETQYLFRDSTSMDWDSVIVAHLDRKIPMYYAGWSVPNVMGHAFICDGYQGEDYFHFNWGWGGQLDGYFYTDNLTPGGNQFNLAQELIINAVPDTNLYTYPTHCEGDKVLTNLGGTFGDGSGPLYGYGNGASCSWLIAPADSVINITLEFLHFELEPGDTVTVYDGDTVTAPVLGTFSGNELPTAITTESPEMLVVFNSDGAGSGEGFLAHYNTVTPVYCSLMVDLTAQSDTLSDGSNNWNYHNNAACLFRIMPAGASTVTLYFTEFATEEGVDELKIFDMQTQELLATYSGTYGQGVPDPVTSYNGKLFVVFSSDYDISDAGWTAYYESNLVNIRESEPNNTLLVYPNPANDILHIKINPAMPENIPASLVDISGRQMAVDLQYNSAFDATMDLRNILPGIYFLRLELPETAPFFEKIIVQ